MKKRITTILRMGQAGRLEEVKQGTRTVQIAVHEAALEVENISGHDVFVQIVFPFLVTGAKTAITRHLKPGEKLPIDFGIFNFSSGAVILQVEVKSFNGDHDMRWNLDLQPCVSTVGLGAQQLQPAAAA